MNSGQEQSMNTSLSTPVKNHFSNDEFTTLVNTFESPDAKQPFNTAHTEKLKPEVPTPAKSAIKTPRTSVKLKNTEAKKLAIAIVENILTKKDDEILPKHYSQFALRMGSDNYVSQSDSELRNGLDAMFLEHSYQVVFQFFHHLQKILTNKTSYAKQATLQYEQLISIITNFKNQHKTDVSNSATVDALTLQLKEQLNGKNIKALEFFELLGIYAISIPDIEKLTGIKKVSTDEIVKRRAQGKTETLDFFDFNDDSFIDPEPLANLIAEGTIDPFALIKLINDTEGSEQSTPSVLANIILDDLISFFKANTAKNSLFAGEHDDPDVKKIFTEHGYEWYANSRKKLLERIDANNLVESDPNNPNVETVAKDSYRVALTFIMDCLSAFKEMLAHKQGFFSRPANYTIDDIRQCSNELRKQLEQQQECSAELQENTALEQGEKFSTAFNNTIDQTPMRESMHQGTALEEALNNEVINFKLSAEEKQQYLIRLLKQQDSTRRNHLIAIAVKEGAHERLQADQLNQIKRALKSLKRQEKKDILEIQTSNWRQQLEIALVPVVAYVNDQLANVDEATASGLQRKKQLNRKLMAIHSALSDLQEQIKPVKKILDELNSSTNIKEKKNSFTFTPKTLKKINSISINVREYLPKNPKDNKASSLVRLAQECVDLREDKEARKADINTNLNLVSTLLENILTDLQNKIDSKWEFDSDKEIYRARKVEIKNALTGVNKLEKNQLYETGNDQTDKHIKQANQLSELAKNDKITTHRYFWPFMSRDKRTETAKKIEAYATMVGGPGYVPLG